MPAAPGSYSIGSVSQGCTNGKGFLSLYGVNSSEGIEIEVTLYRGSAGSNTEVNSYLFPPGASNSGYTFKSLSNGDYFLEYEVTGQSGNIRTFYTVSCAAPPPPPPPEEPVIDCVATFSFTVLPARGPRFILEYHDNKERMHRWEWWQKGYTGEPEPLQGTLGPAVIEYPGIGGKIGTLSGSGASFDIIALRYGLMEAFYTTDEREFRVDHLIEGELHWRGYHMADDYREQWLAVPFLGNVKAYDGIASLANRPYVMPSGERYYGRARSIDVVFRCLRLLDLDLPVWLAVNVFEDTMDLNAEPLSQSYVDQSGYYDEDNVALTCKEVLERILQPYNAFVKQAHAAIHIIRLDETRGPYARRRAEIGNGDSQVRFDLETELYEEAYTIRLNGPVSYREGSQNFYSRPAFKYIDVVTEFGELENFVFNGDFERWVEEKPLQWELTNSIEGLRVADGPKFRLAFPRPGNPTTFLGSLVSEKYGLIIKSDIGYTISFDYEIAIEDFMQPPAGYEWVEYPAFTLSGGTFEITNLPIQQARALFNGTEAILSSGVVQSGISAPGTGQKRTDLVYATAAGFTYVQGTETALASEDLVIVEPDNTLLVTYITWEGAEPHFASTSSALAAVFSVKADIGEYGVNLRPTASRRRANMLYSKDEPENKNNIGGWVLNQERPIDFYITDLSSKDGYTSVKGKFTLHTRPLATAGIPRLAISNPRLNRNNMRGVTITIDNVKFTERDNGFERMVIEGENPGHINTPPVEITLHHGSSGIFGNEPIMPRCEALLTLADGSATQYWNGGHLLQEITARDVMNQHLTQTLVLTATLDGTVSPISILKDIDRANVRLLVDQYAWDTRTGLTQIEAFEVFGGAEDVRIPENAMLYEDGTPMLYETGDYMLYEES